MKIFLMKYYMYIRLVFAIGLVVTGAILFVTESNKLAGKSLLIAGLIGHLYFFLQLFLRKRQGISIF
ncbi:MAG: hypothetical protein KIT62_04335 [Cyclobacteriaceae bacterium]|nr:hypothetical protein [Cyclobacteriaceae bacterium]